MARVPRPTFDFGERVLMFLEPEDVLWVLEEIMYSIVSIREDLAMVQSVGSEALFCANASLDDLEYDVSLALYTLRKFIRS